LKSIDCARCGSNELTEIEGFLVCNYCRSKFVPESSDLPPIETNIELNADVQRLLDMCEKDPVNRHRYASLILDIDPTNQIARRYF